MAYTGNPRFCRNISMDNIEALANLTKTEAQRMAEHRRNIERKISTPWAYVPRTK